MKYPVSPLFQDKNGGKVEVSKLSHSFDYNWQAWWPNQGKSRPGCKWLELPLHGYLEILQFIKLTDYLD